LMGGYIREMEKQSWMLNAWTKRNHEKLNRTAIEQKEALKA